MPPPKRGVRNTGEQAMLVTPVDAVRRVHRLCRARMMPAASAVSPIEHLTDSVDRSQTGGGGRRRLDCTCCSRSESAMR